MRAFIRQYASAVGDGNQLVDIYDGKEPAIVEEPKPVYEELKDHVSNCMTKKSNPVGYCGTYRPLPFVNWFSHMRS